MSDLEDYLKSPQWTAMCERMDARKRASHEPSEWPYGDPADQWEHRGVRCILLFGGIAMCGYVCVKPGHPWFDKDYDDVDADVWGGLTFRCRDMDGNDWFGWDNAHLTRCPDERAETTRLADQAADALEKLA